MKTNKSTLKPSVKDNFYLLKWLLLISVCLILGGVLSFSLILISIRIIDGPLAFSPIWIVGMIPLMALVAVPVTMLIYRQLVRSLHPLLMGMEKVAGGDLNTYLPTANAKDFTKVYENFNKMVGEIQSVESLRTTMLDNLSHELKTPIASISGFSKLLIEKDLTVEKQKQYLSIIVAESDRLDKMVKNILLLGKLDAQEIVANKEIFSLDSLMQDCIIALEHEWSDKGISMEANMSNISFNGDKELLKSIWLNLLSNSIKFTPSGGEITITMHEDVKNVFVLITDNGIGMSEDTIKHIFDRHFQADTSQKGKGQGLGLAIVKRAVKLCNGKISVESAQNKGSTFTIELPKNI